MKKKNIRVKVGVRVRALRNATSMSQEAFADKVGYSRSYMSQIERGAANITVDVAQVLADAFKIEVKSLFDFSVKPLKKPKKISVPFALDGTYFNPALKRPHTGRFTVGQKGALVQMESFDEALMHLKSMDTAYWLRPNKVRHWGIVKAARWGYIEI